jgi:hypothetical protein
MIQTRIVTSRGTVTDSNGFIKSFATAYVGADSVLRMTGRGIQAVPEYHEE